MCKKNYTISFIMENLFHSKENMRKMKLQLKLGLISSQVNF